MKERDKYLKLVEWSDEDQCYIGSIPGWIGQCCHGAEEEKVYHELCQIADEWIEIYKMKGCHFQAQQILFACPFVVPLSIP